MEKSAHYFNTQERRDRPPRCSACCITRVMFTLRNSEARAIGDTPSKATDVGVGLSVNVIDLEALQIVRAT